MQPPAAYLDGPEVAREHNDDHDEYEDVVAGEPATEHVEEQGQRLEQHVEQTRHGVFRFAHNAANNAIAPSELAACRALLTFLETNS